jgi:hypothetical protein
VRTAQRRQQNKPGAGRPAKARPCSACGREAFYAVHILTRTIGRGQSRDKRAIKTSAGVLFCNSCGRDLKRKAGDLGDAAAGVMSHVLRNQARPEGPSLFDQAAVQ